MKVHAFFTGSDMTVHAFFTGSDMKVHVSKNSGESWSSGKTVWASFAVRFQRDFQPFLVMWSICGLNVDSCIMWTHSILGRDSLSDFRVGVARI